MVDATHVKVIETDAGAQLVGDVYKQPAGLFTNASFRNGFVFAFLGSTGAGVLGEGGVLTLDGTGNVTTATSTIDINANGTVHNSLAVSGTYNLASVAGQAAFRWGVAMLPTVETKRRTRTKMSRSFSRMTVLRMMEGEAPRSPA